MTMLEHAGYEIILLSSDLVAVQKGYALETFRSSERSVIIL